VLEYEKYGQIREPMTVATRASEAAPLHDDPPPRSPAPTGLGPVLARRLSELRRARGLSLAALAGASGVSRATLSRMEKAEVSPTTETLARLCAVYGITLSRLLAEVEPQFTARLPAEAQPVWRDAEAGFTRRALSPPAADLAVELAEISLDPGAVLDYPAPTRSGGERHLAMRAGALRLTLGETTHLLGPGDTLRYREVGPARFAAGPEGARYILVLA
jgi:transcriptional regulator with XRE-family HTH domain